MASGDKLVGQCLVIYLNVSLESATRSPTHDSETNFIVTLVTALHPKKRHAYRLYFCGTWFRCGQKPEIVPCDGETEEPTLLSWDTVTVSPDDEVGH